MATRKGTAAFILEQLGHPGRFRVKAMFGEFALYADDKVVGLICDDQLFVKITEESAALAERCDQVSPYPGARAHHLVPEDVIAGDLGLPAMLLRMAGALPSPGPKRASRAKR